MNTLEKIALTKIKGIGPKNGRALLAYCGSVEAIFESSKKQLLHIPGIGHTIIEAIANNKSALKEAEKELEFIDRHHITALWIEDDAYPKRLKNCEDAPLLLYYKGSADLNPSRTISIVGTRTATPYGKKLCEELIHNLKGLSVQVISGLAYGIDVHAHRQSVKNEINTVAVLGHGLDRIYPAAHREIASKILMQGGILTEFTSGTNPDKQNFPMRNRIIAGLADVTVVIEAAHRGGALITAEIANSYNRDVCAFPGAVDQAYSAGCNYLIKTNRAHLIRNAEDLCYLMNWETSTYKSSSRQLKLIPEELTKDESKVYHYILDQVQVSIDAISLYCDWPQSKLAIILLEMEMKNILLSLPGKIYRLI